MRLNSVLLAPLALGATASARFVMYYDQYHVSRPTNAADRAGIDHLILAFVKSNDMASYQPHVPIATMRSEYPKAKIMAAIGGWGDTVGFSAACKSEATIAQFAKDVKAVVDKHGLDGIDCDWEYPGGNGADYKQIPNSAKVGEIDCFPKVLAAIRTAIGKEKLLSIAVPGKSGDMIAFTKQTGPKIWPSVDHVNVMSYDLMNRRDTVTAHHTSVEGSKQAVQNYLDIGCPAEKINLGFAFYAKFFSTKGDCSASPLGCPIVLAENPDGSDAGTSGAYTFETVNMKPISNASIPDSTDGTCSLEKGKCPNSCCSQYGNCGTTPAHCGTGCQYAFGKGCTGPDVAGSWQTAVKGGKADEKAGGEYFFDAKNKLFWTWDTLEFMDRKFKVIVEELGLGGVMSWSLGEDSFDWSHIRKLGTFADSYQGPNSTTKIGSEGENAKMDLGLHRARPVPAEGAPYNDVPVEGAESTAEGEDFEFQRVRKRDHARHARRGGAHVQA